MNIAIKNNNLTATISTKGAELISLRSDKREFIWEGNPEFWGKHSPVLFPIVGTLKDNSYNYLGDRYLLSRHGFARDMVFDVKEQSEDSVIFSLQSSEETLKNYPFAFELQLIYTLYLDKLILQYKVINNDKKELPFSIGAHPAFALPKDFSNYSLSFDEDNELEYFLLENDLLSDRTSQLNLSKNKLHLHYPLFENDALVFKKLQSKAITINENEQPILKISFHDFPNLGIWTKVDAPFICIEPWFGHSDTPKNSGAIMEKEGVVILKKDKIFESQFSIEIVC
ncbi:aldose 1-epimerase family protein [Flavobacterium soli]|uniref:aldose 1-epimerase family protein n=1 Tax=Flavobacterium soli TaxID=344881 RepID=UPI000429C9E6|nr:aldose 1-epimerase family protein [Flavobacterium soli]